MKLAVVCCVVVMVLCLLDGASARQDREEGGGARQAEGGGAGGGGEAGEADVGGGGGGGRGERKSIKYRPTVDRRPICSLPVDPFGGTSSAGRSKIHHFNHIVMVYCLFRVLSRL